MPMTTANLTPAAALLAAAVEAMMDLRNDMFDASGRPSLEALAIHRTRVEALFAEDGPVARFNALAADRGFKPIVMGSGLWPCVHADAVAQMFVIAVTVTD